MSAAKPPERRQWEEAARWLARADEDIRAAEALIGAGATLVGPAAFHCQQAAEKMAKAVLIAYGQPPPRIHDILTLGRRVSELHAQIGAAIETLGGMTSWYAAARYPDASVEGGPSIADLREMTLRLHELIRRIEGLNG